MWKYFTGNIWIQKTFNFRTNSCEPKKAHKLNEKRGLSAFQQLYTSINQSYIEKCITFHMKTNISADVQCMQRYWERNYLYFHKAHKKHQKLIKPSNCALTDFDVSRLLLTNSHFTIIHIWCKAAYWFYEIVATNHSA